MRFIFMLSALFLMLFLCPLNLASAAETSSLHDSNMRIVAAAARNAAIAVPGTDPAFLMAIASRESNFTADARSDYSSATGWFQFTDLTWLTAVMKYGSKHGRSAEANMIYVDNSGSPTIRNGGMRQFILALRKDVKFSAVMTAEMLMEQKEDIEAILGRKARGIDMYMTHAMGAGGAAGFLRGVAKGRNMSVYSRMAADMEKRRTEALMVLAEGISRDDVMVEASAPGGGFININKPKK